MNKIAYLVGLTALTFGLGSIAQEVEVEKPTKEELQRTHQQQLEKVKGAEQREKAAEQEFNKSHEKVQKLKAANQAHNAAIKKVDAEAAHVKNVQGKFRDVSEDLSKLRKSKEALEESKQEIKDKLKAARAERQEAADKAIKAQQRTAAHRESATHIETRIRTMHPTSEPRVAH